MRRLLLSAWLFAGVLAVVVVVRHHQAEPPSPGALAPWMTHGSGGARTEAALPKVSPAVIEWLLDDYEIRRSLEIGSNRAISMSLLERLIAEASQATGLDADLIRAVVRTESDFRPAVVSSAGAVGLMQVRPVVAVDMVNRVTKHQADWLQRFAELDGDEITPEDLADPRVNILLGSHYLAYLHQRYADFGEPMALWLALAAYNWGPGNVYRHLLSNPDLHGFEDLRRLLEQSAPGETRAFIERVLKRSGYGLDAV
ncbi:hypothetical protein CKO15_08220 [Halorhodospira abdelmalekii]|uniref:lytic transglycosylase domain-containing protein n=1 Tax=Halorhodospira abdelmalekii TaxID=421629 RepID=UPI00190589D8|nr:lytic transglycosylase domain-containing protein [Halorhodospira abdelmalekii]MBK1735271.1 hypothetical protein [Halorhodospira abdelmalekii]